MRLGALVRTSGATAHPGGCGTNSSLPVFSMPWLWPGGVMTTWPATSRSLAPSSVNGRAAPRSTIQVGRAPRGQRLRVGVPHGHWLTTTFVAGLSTRGIIAPFVLDGPINLDAFETYMERVLVPTLRPGDV